MVLNNQTQLRRKIESIQIQILSNSGKLLVELLVDVPCDRLECFHFNSILLQYVDNRSIQILALFTIISTCTIIFYIITFGSVFSFLKWKKFCEKFWIIVERHSRIVLFISSFLKTFGAIVQPRKKFFQMHNVWI